MRRSLALLTLSLAACGEAQMAAAPVDEAGGSAPVARLTSAEPAAEWPLSRPSEPFVYVVDSYMTSISFLLSFEEDGDEPQLTVETPSGALIERSSGDADDNVSWQRETVPVLPGAPAQGLWSLSIRDPEPGTWKARVDGRDRDLEAGTSLSFDRETWYRLHLQSTLGYLPGCSGCLVFEAFVASDYDQPPPAPTGLQARGRRFLFSGPEDGKQTATGASDLVLVDDGSGIDPRAGDGRFTSQPWRPTPASRPTLMIEIVGTLDGVAFERSLIRSYDLSADGSGVGLLVAGPQPAVELGGELSVAATVAGERVTLGRYEIVELTADWDARIEWSESPASLQALLQSAAGRRAFEVAAWLHLTTPSQRAGPPPSDEVERLDHAFRSLTSLRGLSEALVGLRQVSDEVEIRLESVGGS